VKKLLLVALAAIGGLLVYRQIQADRAEQDLWTEATDSVPTGSLVPTPVSEQTPAASAVGVLCCPTTPAVHSSKRIDCYGKRRAVQILSPSRADASFRPCVRIARVARGRAGQDGRDPELRGGGA